MNKLDIAKKVLKSRFITHYPIVLAHMVTRRCNGSCEMCGVKYIERTGKELTTEETFSMLDDAERTGMVSYIAWGGEPLLRDDLGGILEHAKSKNMHTTVTTNGYLLPQKADEIGLHTDKLIVSIDHPSEKHDEERKLKGTFRNAVKGIEEMGKYGTDTIINTVITNFNKDAIEDMAEFADELDVKISFQPMDVYEYNKHLKVPERELSSILERLRELKRGNSRIINSYNHLSTTYKRKRHVCHAPKIFIHLNEVGDVESCPPTGSKFFGNVRKTNLVDIFRSAEYQKYMKEAESCKRCNVSSVTESSFVYSFKPEALLNAKDIIV